jgi:hypothetical protein
MERIEIIVFNTSTPERLPALVRPKRPTAGSH